MAKKPFPLHKRILFQLLVPVAIVGTVCATLLVTTLSAPMKDFLTDQFDANIKFASLMGLRVCEESFDYLMELRFEKDEEMNRVLQVEALEKIKTIGSQFPHIHLLVLESDRAIAGGSLNGLPDRWAGASLAGQDDAALVLRLDGKTIRSHVHYFPFWDWHIIGFAFEKDCLRPVHLAYRITYASAVGTFLAVVITLLIVFHLFIDRPLNRLVAATDGVADGRFEKIETIARSEFGRLMASFNAMVERLEREQAQVSDLIHQLKESETRFKALHNASFGGIGIHDGGVILACNQGLADITGYSMDELIGMEGMSLIAERDRAMVMRNIAAGYEKPYEAIGVRKNGEEFPIRLEGRNIPYKGKTVRTTEFRDITRQKQAEQDLRHLKNYLANIIDSMPSVLVGVDREGRVTQWNRQAQRTTGVSLVDARSRPLTDVFPRLREALDSIETAIRERRVLRHIRVPRQQAGGMGYEDVTIFPLTGNGVEGAVIRVDDVTERVRLEEMMIQSEKMLSVGGLAAGMAHEINNPLAGILQNALVLENRLLGDLPANHHAAEAAGMSLEGLRAYLASRKLPGMIGNIRESANRAAEIVRNMLSFARKSDRVVSRQDLGDLLDQTLELVRTDYNMKKRYDVKQIRIERAYDPSVPSVPCEASKLQQVFLNILKNGAEAMAETVDARDPPAFVLRVEDDGDWVRVEIEDNGPGMADAIRRRIFEPFYTTKPVGQGTGLGLSVSYFIVTEDHGGEMAVRRAEGGGTCFVIRLPKGR